MVIGIQLRLDLRNAWTRRSLPLIFQRQRFLNIQHIHKTAMTELNHSRQPTIQTLPAEILFKILSYLNANCLSLAGAVCREWNALGNEDLLWKELW